MKLLSFIIKTFRVPIILMIAMILFFLFSRHKEVTKEMGNACLFSEKNEMFLFSNLEKATFIHGVGITPHTYRGIISSFFFKVSDNGLVFIKENMTPFVSMNTGVKVNKRVRLMKEGNILFFKVNECQALAFDSSFKQSSLSENTPANIVTKSMGNNSKAFSHVISWIESKHIEDNPLQKGKLEIRLNKQLIFSMNRVSHPRRLQNMMCTLVEKIKK